MQQYVLFFSCFYLYFFLQKFILRTNIQDVEDIFFMRPNYYFSQKCQKMALREILNTSSSRSVFFVTRL